MGGARPQLDVDLPVGRVEHDAPFVGDVDPGRVVVPPVGEEDARPARSLHVHLVDVDDQARQAPAEDPRLHVVFGAGGDRAVNDVAERLIGVGQQHDEGVAGRRRRRRRQADDRPQQTVDVHAARLQDDDFPIRGQPTQPHQQTDEHGHRNGDAEGLGDQRQQETDDRPAVHALGHQFLGVPHDRRDQHQEREDQQAQEEERQRFAEHVAVDQAEHRGPIVPTPAPRRAAFRRGLRLTGAEPDAWKRCRPADKPAVDPLIGPTKWVR